MARSLGDQDSQPCLDQAGSAPIPAASVFCAGNTTDNFVPLMPSQSLSHVPKCGLLSGLWFSTGLCHLTGLGLTKLCCRSTSM